ncbi:MAG: choice-of-anchor D domain-containing protein [Bacteroidetes bacterium]|nr:choice-of-anchor D domain-containing protein [Bacteroidota bacterium]
MKKMFFYFLFLFVLLFFSTEKSSAAQQYYYVVFDNLDVITNTDGVPISNAFDDLYYLPVKNSVEYGQYYVKLPFSDATFASYPITNFDLAVFPMGDTPLNYTTPGGISVLSKIKEMEAAGRRVIIIGRSLLWKAFQSQPNQQVQSFFYNYLGVDDVFSMTTHTPITNGWRYDGYTINGYPSDPISDDARKWANCRRSSYGSDWYDPWKWTKEVEAFRIRNDTTKYIPIEWASKVIDDYAIIRQPISDTTMGCRVFTDNSKMVFWCFGFEYLNAWISISLAQSELRQAFKWLLFDVPKIEAYAMLVPNPVYYGAVSIDTIKIQGIKVTNWGRKKLSVNDVYTFGYEDPDIFTVLNPNPFELQPLDTHTVFIKFSPKEEKSYLEILTFESNSYLSSSQDVELKGLGGPEKQQGPAIAVEDTVYFDTTDVKSFDIKPVTIYSIGTSELILLDKKITDNGGGVFTFNTTEDSKSGIAIQPGTTHVFNVRFVPQTYNTESTGQIKLNSNRKGDNPYSYITLKGWSSPPMPKIKFEVQTTDTMKVIKGSNQENLITITNFGSSDLIIDKIEFTKNDSSVFSFVEGTANVPITIAKSEWHDLKVNFSPDDTVIYSCSIKIESDAVNLPVTTINLKGQGFPIVTVEEPPSASNEMFSMKAMPNPNYGKAVVNYVLKGETQNKVEIFLVDLLGNRISTFINSTLSPGEYRLEMDVPAAKLASGTYFIIANVGDTQVRLPIVILK